MLPRMPERDRSPASRSPDPLATFRWMNTASTKVRVDRLAANPQLIKQVGLLRWREWAYGEKDSTRFVDVSRDEAGDGVHLPMTLVAIDSAGDALRGS